MSNINSVISEAGSQLQQICRLNYEQPAQHCLQTKLVCTIGFATRSVEFLEKLILNGLSIIRLNFSYETHEQHAETIEYLQEAIENASTFSGYRYHIGVALDIKGPEIRTGLLENVTEIELKKNDNIRLSINKNLIAKGTKECIYVDYANIINVAEVGSKVYIDDGAIELIIKEVAVDCLICQIERGGKLGNRKGIYLPGCDVDLPAVSEKDRFDLKFGIDNNVDFIFVSKLRSVSAISEIRSVLGPKGKDIKIIVKLENTHALSLLDELISTSDGIIFSRGDLGIEMSPEKIFLAQKAVIARCNRAGKPVFIFSQLTESMRHNNHPSRAEVADIGNIVIDGADGIISSSETAIGPFAGEVIKYIATICREAECAVWYRNLFEDLNDRNPAMIDAAHAIGISAVDASRKTQAKAIVVLSTSGRSAYLIGKYRPRCPILTVTRCSRTARQSNLYRGIFAFLYTEIPDEDWLKDIDLRVQYALNAGHKMKILKMGDAVIVVSPWKNGTGFTNNMRIVYAFFETEEFECMFKKDTLNTQKILQNHLVDL